MTHEQLTEKVRDRAHWQAQQAIKDFRSTVLTALHALVGYDDKDRRAASEAYWAGSGAKWPKSIWKMREEKIMEELLSTMDAMQKLMAGPSADPDSPQRAEDPE